MSTLTGRELDAAIAERLEEWIWVTTSKNAKYRFLVDRQFAERQGFLLDTSNTTYIDRSTVLDYHEDWRDTWRAILVAKKKKGIGFQISSTEHSVFVDMQFPNKFGLYTHRYRYCNYDQVNTVVCQLILDILDDMEKEARGE